MPQRTVVVKVPPERRQGLKDRLEPGAFEWRSAPHAQWSVKGEGVVATLYDSGKLVGIYRGGGARDLYPDAPYKYRRCVDVHQLMQGLPDALGVSNDEGK